jgi:hypothetical protein
VRARSARLSRRISERLSSQPGGAASHSGFRWAIHSDVADTWPVGVGGGRARRSSHTNTSLGRPPGPRRWSASRRPGANRPRQRGRERRRTRSALGQHCVGRIARRDRQGFPDNEGEATGAGRVRGQPRAWCGDRGCGVRHRHGRPVVDLWGGVADPATGRVWCDDTPPVVFSTTKSATAAPGR